MSVYRTIGPLVSRFGFEGWILVLIASVTDVGILFTFKQDARGVNAHIHFHLLIHVHEY